MKFLFTLTLSISALAYNSVANAQTAFTVLSRPVNVYVRMGALEVADSHPENVDGFGQLIKVVLNFNYVEECSNEAKTVEINGAVSGNGKIKILSSGDVDIALLAKPQVPHIACGGSGSMKKGSFTVYINNSSAFFEDVAFLNVGAPTIGLYKELYKLSAKNGVASLEKVFMYRFFQGKLDTAALGE